MSRVGLRSVRSGLVALLMITSQSAIAQPITGTEAERAIHTAQALSAQIGAFHRGPGIWTGCTPPPPRYCRTMSGGEYAVKNLARIANKALLYRQTGLVLRLESAGAQLSDELDAEEVINDEAGMTYSEYPCPAATSAFAARAMLLAPIDRRIASCHERANALRVSFAARREVMQHCLHLPGRQFTQSEPTSTLSKQPTFFQRN